MGVLGDAPAREGSPLQPPLLSPGPALLLLPLFFFFCFFVFFFFSFFFFFSLLFLLPYCSQRFLISEEILPLSSEHGTYKTVKARFWARLSCSRGTMGDAPAREGSPRQPPLLSPGPALLLLLLLPPLLYYA